MALRPEGVGEVDARITLGVVVVVGRVVVVVRRVVGCVAGAATWVFSIGGLPVKPDAGLGRGVAETELWDVSELRVRKGGFVFLVAEP